MEEKLPRLQKFMADCGYCSRRAAEELIRAGHVKINGRIAVLGDRVNPSRDKVEVRGRPLRARRERPVYIMLNKPRGYVTTLDDELGRRCITELIRDVGPRVVPVGRLDRDSEGLLLLTNDGQLVYKLTHPSHGVTKTYVVTVEGDVSQQQLEMLNGPMEIEGYVIRPVPVDVIDKKADRTVLRFVLSEGRNRQVRHMCEKAGLRVLRLKRIAIGELTLSRVPVGKWRELTPAEVNYLKGL